MKQTRFRQETVLPKEGQELSKSARPLHWAKKAHQLLSRKLIIKLHVTYLDHDKTHGEDQLTRHLKNKYKHLIERFRETIPILKALSESLDTQMKLEDEDVTLQLAQDIFKKIVSEFGAMIDWCVTTHSWTMSSAKAITSPSVIDDYLRYITSPHRGDRPLAVTREAHNEETKKTRDKKNVKDLLR